MKMSELGESYEVVLSAMMNKSKNIPAFCTSLLYHCLMIYILRKTYIRLIVLWFTGSVEMHGGSVFWIKLIVTGLAS